VEDNVEMKVSYISLIGFIAGLAAIWIGFYIYRAESEESIKSPNKEVYSSDSRISIKLDGISNEFIKYPIKYISIISFIGCIAISIIFSNLSIFSFEIKTEYLILFFLFMSIILEVDSRLPIGIALFLLTSCPFLILLGYLESAEKIATYAFYFLSVGLAMQITEYIRAQRVKIKEIPDKQDKRTTEKAVFQAREEVVFASRASNKDIAISFPSIGIISQELDSHQSPLLDNNIPIQEQHKIDGRRRKRAPKKKLRFSIFSITILLSLIIVIIMALSWNTILQVFKVDEKNTVPVSKIRTSSSKAIMQAKPALAPQIEKSKAKVQILNGNGIKGEGARIASLLKEEGFNVQQVGDAKRSDYPQTIINCKSNQKDIANLLAESIIDIYPSTVQADLPSNSPFDIVITLGINNTTHIQQATILILNGNSINNEATRITGILKNKGYNVVTPNNADKNYTSTIIQYKEGKKDTAELIAKEISSIYPATLEEKPSTNLKADVVVTLGMDQIQ